jgi:hypothetical protein
MRKSGKGWISASGFLGSELREFKCPNLTYNNPENAKSGKVGLALRGFGVRNFVSSSAPNLTCNNPENMKKESWIRRLQYLSVENLK